MSTTNSNNNNNNNNNLLNTDLIARMSTMNSNFHPNNNLLNPNMFTNNSTISNPMPIPNLPNNNNTNSDYNNNLQTLTNNINLINTPFANSNDNNINTTNTTTTTTTTTSSSNIPPISNMFDSSAIGRAARAAESSSQLESLVNSTPHTVTDNSADIQVKKEERSNRKGRKSNGTQLANAELGLLSTDYLDESMEDLDPDIMAIDDPDDDDWDEGEAAAKYSDSSDYDPEDHKQRRRSKKSAAKRKSTSSNNYNTQYNNILGNNPTLYPPSANNPYFSSPSTSTTTPAKGKRKYIRKLKNELGVGAGAGAALEKKDIKNPDRVLEFMVKIELNPLVKTEEKGNNDQSLQTLANNADMMIDTNTNNNASIPADFDLVTVRIVQTPAIYVDEEDPLKSLEKRQTRGRRAKAAAKYTEDDMWDYEGFGFDEYPEFVSGGLNYANQSKSKRTKRYYRSEIGSNYHSLVNDPAYVDYGKYKSNTPPTTSTTNTPTATTNPTTVSPTNSNSFPRTIPTPNSNSRYPASSEITHKMGEEIRTRLRQKMADRGVNQSQLCLLWGVSNSTLCMWFQGRNSVQMEHRLYHAAKDWIANEDNNNPNNANTNNSNNTNTNANNNSATNNANATNVNNNQTSTTSNAQAAVQQAQQQSTQQISNQPSTPQQPMQIQAQGQNLPQYVPMNPGTNYQYYLPINNVQLLQQPPLNINPNYKQQPITNPPVPQYPFAQLLPNYTQFTPQQQSGSNSSNNQSKPPTQSNNNSSGYVPVPLPEPDQMMNDDISNPVEPFPFDSDMNNVYQQQQQQSQ